MRIVQFINADNEKRIYINPDSVALVEPTEDKNRTLVHLSNGREILVQGSDYYVVSGLRG